MIKKVAICMFGLRLLLLSGLERKYYVTFTFSIFLFQANSATRRVRLRPNPVHNN